MLHIMISCAGVTGSVGITRHACITQIAGLNPQSSRAQVPEDCCIPSKTRNPKFCIHTTHTTRTIVCSR